MRKTVLILAMACCMVLASSAIVSAQVINELNVNPNSTDGPCEYIELRGTPNSIIQDVYFVAIEGDAVPSGTADVVVTFGNPGPAFGSNGLIVITGTQPCGSRTYPAETARFQAAFLDTSAGGIENGTNSYLLISSPTPIVQGTDYDADNNGTLELLPAGAVILDAVAWSDGDAGDLTYGPVVISAFGGTIGAVTRSSSDLTRNSSNVWYGGAMTGPTGVNDTTTYSTSVFTAGFPSNGVLTPGAPNTGGPIKDAPMDIDGDGKTDYVVVRPAGGAGSQLTWFNAINGGNPTANRDWGVSGDVVLAADFDGDGKDDEAIWRGTNATFYIILSGSLTMRVDTFGQPGDNPRVVADYNGDLRDDVAVYRPGAQGTWFYKTSQTALFNSVQWGQTGDVPAPGDYDNDGKADYVVKRAEGGNARFFTRLATGVLSSEVFGQAADSVAPGDYDNDGKTDLAVVRTVGGLYTWDFEPSGTAGSTVVSDTWGVPGDVIVQGDYDGDGKTDYAVWRPGAQGRFFVMTPVTRLIFGKEWGQTGDTPAANFNVF